MALRKFGPNEIVLNTMRTYPHVEYTIYDGVVYYNNTPRMSGSRSNNVLAVATGGISLYEYNIDRTPVDTGRFVPQYWDPVNSLFIAGEGSVADTGMIYPFITKDSARSSFKTIGQVSYTNEFANHDVLTANYPLSGTIAREMMWWPAQRRIEVNDAGEPGKVVDLGDFQDPTLNPGEYYTTPYHPHFYALKNRLNHYGYLSPYYRVCTSSYSLSPGDKSGQIKPDEPLGLISIPAIAFGSKIQPGSVSLKWYYTGSLLGELRDTKHNGELIETIGEFSGTVAGVCLYNEGFMVLTGAWVIPGATNQIHLDPISGVDWPRWYYFGAGAYDGMTSHIGGYGSFVTASFNMSFKGQTDIQVYTLFANARRGEANFSNNRTFFEYGQEKVEYESSTVYQESATRKMKNIGSSSYLGYDAPFKRQVFISKVGIFDDSENLIGIATLADPVLKKEDEEYTFKIKLDI